MHPLNIIIFSAFVGMFGCTSKPVPTTNNDPTKIIYTCQSGEKFYIRYNTPPSNNLEEAAIKRFAPVYGEKPEDCSSKTPPESVNIESTMVIPAYKCTEKTKKIICKDGKTHNLCVLSKNTEIEIQNYLERASMVWGNNKNYCSLLEK